MGFCRDSKLNYMGVNMDYKILSVFLYGFFWELQKTTGILSGLQETPEKKHWDSIAFP